MPITFAFVAQKGGVGKSTLAMATAAELVARGRRVLLVDADPQGTSRTWAAVAASTGHPAPTAVAMDASLQQPGQLDALADGFDVVVIDTPPRHGEIMRAALMMADVAVLPCGPSIVDGWALAESLEVVRQAQGLRPRLKACIVVSKKVARTSLGNNAREVLADVGLPVLRVEIHSRIAFQEFPGTGLGLGQYAPGTPAAAELAALVDELETFSTTGDVNHGDTEANHAGPQAA